ncbi:SRPBCC family protein [Nitratireductor sp. ZSWI3]|uniref:SRPBCC family protein n=1 Tax=Nitratireductor sp. ZSWI3 TaxID=2966359 RepID=UPI00214FFAD7|nr:SRPBCC family protein [Nitratireductor sp. ZSWI3]MCR4266375.1 SRPBCC family protein [Nitratireductor sp. ZSWI3]
MRQVDPNGFGIATAPDTVRFERLLPGPAERVWAYLTEADKRRQWLAGGEMELKPGGAATLVFRHSEFTDEEPPEQYRSMNEEGFVSQGRIIECDPPRLLAMSWPGDGTESQVQFELFPEGEKVLLVVTHTRLADRGEMANVSGGWHAHLGVLRAVLEGGETPAFWSRIEALEQEYRKRYRAD